MVFDKIRSFFIELKEEINKISFPDKQAVITATRSIAIIVFFTAIYMEVLDFIFKAVFKYLLRINI